MAGMGSQGAVPVCCFTDAPFGADYDMDAILFMTANRKDFAGDEERAAFHERWLGRYLRTWPEWCYVALAPEDSAVGYLAGCPVNPADAPEFADIGYYLIFEELCAEYPAHIHINILDAWRKYGTGRLLVEAFAEKCAGAGIPGLHAVTLEGHENNGFFSRCGLKLRGTADWGGRKLGFFGRRL